MNWLPLFIIMLLLSGTIYMSGKENKEWEESRREAVVALTQLVAEYERMKQELADCRKQRCITDLECEEAYDEHTTP